MGGELDAASARGGVFTIPLSRWSTISERGWYGGDNHIHHISPKTCRLEMDAEDLNVANILTSDFTLDQTEFEGRLNKYSGSHSLIYVNQEFRNNHLGHMCLLNLKELIQPVATMQPNCFPLHAQVCDRARAQGGYVTWAHFPSMPSLEKPARRSLGEVGLSGDSVRDRAQGAAGVRQEARPGNDSQYRAAYVVSVSELRLPAYLRPRVPTKMTTFVTVGANRVYAQVEGEFTYPNWIDALKRGRTFVSNSPMLTFTVNGQQAGSSLALNSSKDRVLQIHAKAESQLPYDRLEIVRNGDVIGSATPSGPLHKAEIHLEYPLRGSGWIAARALEDLHRYPGVEFDKIHRSEGTLFSSLYGTRRPEDVFAHTSPVYAMLDGKPIRSWDDAQYYVRYLAHAIDWLKQEARFSSAEDKKSSIEAFEQGKRLYEQRASEGVR